MKIGVKLVSLISIFNIIGIVILAGVTVTLARREISRLAEEQAEILAEKGIEEIKSWFGIYVDTARAVAHIMEGYKDIPADERRDQFNFMLKQTFTAHPEADGVYANWAPNALDNMDADYANTPGTDETGQYIPSWNHGSDGPVLLPITGFPWEAVMQVTGGEEFVFEPALATLEGHMLYNSTLVVNICIPVKDNGKLVGVTGIVFELSRIQAIAETIKPFGDGSALVFSSGGIVSAHTDPDRLGKNMRESEVDTFGSSLDSIFDAVTTGKSIAFSVPSAERGIMQYYAVPFTIGQYPNPWTLVVGVSRNTIMAPVYRMLYVSIIIGVLTVLLISGGIILIIASSVSRPITTLSSLLKNISEGEGDLTKTITLITRDEIGDLAHYFNLTITKIKKLVRAIKNEADGLSHTGAALASNMTQTAGSITEITATIQNIKTQVGNQRKNVKEAGSIMNDVVEGIDSLNAQIHEQSDCVSQSSSAVEQMLANINSVTQTLIKNSENVVRLAESSEKGRTGLETVSADIQTIARESAGLLEINAVMESIASQTNLLSMNAAIEAAHAGESGKGFAVVADEIRKLAESSGEQSKTISGVLKNIKASIEKIMSSTDIVLQGFTVIGEGVRTVTEQESSVRTAMEEQRKGSTQILESINRLYELSATVQQGANAMRTASHSVFEVSRGLEQITEEIGDGMEEMAVGAEEINGAVYRVTEISGETKRQIDTLMQEVSRFKVSS
ncbi:MAG: methyl-accepting chemotaxis protein [Treponema sp.]|jgi:methyl-accepting chemotaxis protein|nr:methyl-accepting chemotaxis protein [Treponema sp.]